MLISYEIPQVLTLLGVVIFTNTMSLSGVVHWQDHYNTWLIFLQPLALVIYLISASVEINRTPTDIAEAESEIVAGYHTEYSGIKFGVLLRRRVLRRLRHRRRGNDALFGRLDLLGPGGVGARLADLPRQDVSVFWLFIWMRGTLPRLRVDQLMAFAWKFLLPLTPGEHLRRRSGGAHLAGERPVGGGCAACLRRHQSGPGRGPDGGLGALPGPRGPELAAATGAAG